MVHVKKVEIFGFKSFGFTNTTVQFEPGLVSISGPNGSGKSNILDAIIFALGENKPKIMRVDRLRSLLHDVENNRRGPKMARSSVHFDNSDRRIPVDSNTVEITREMDANGENTYYLNKKKTNRSHILDLLDMANSGLGQLNAVQQGTVTRISEFTSEEKRKTIEDLIGLSYFDEKKTEAIKQLDEADRRLEIALAKMGEIKKRIDELEEERSQAMRHSMLTREIDRYKAISAANRIKSVSTNKKQAEEELREIASQNSTLEERRGILQAEETELESQKAHMMKAASEYTQSKATLDTQISSAMEQYETYNSSISASEKRMQQIDTRIPDIKVELGQIGDARVKTKSDLADAKKIVEKINVEREQIGAELRDADLQREKILKEQSEAAQRQSEIDSRIKELTTQLNAEEMNIVQIQHRQKQAKARIDADTARLCELEQGISTLAGHRTGLQAIIDRHTASIVRRSTAQTRLHKKKITISQDIEELVTMLEKSNKAATQYESKIKTVKTLMHEDYSVAKIKEEEAIKHDSKSGANLGIEGLVYEMISWDKEYERCVLAAGADWIKAVVVKDLATMLGLAKVARDKKLPKLKIIPLDTIPMFEAVSPKMGDPDILGTLSEHIQCLPGYESVKMFLFGNVVLARTREAAHSISKSGYKAVTLDGEFFEADGGAVVIDINSKISKITKIISMSGDIDGLFKSIGLIKKYTQKKRRTIKRIEASAQYISNKISRSEKALTSARENHTILESRIESAATTKSSIKQRLSELESQVPEFALQVSASESRVKSLHESIGAQEANRSLGDQSRIAAMLAEVNTKKAEIEKTYTAAGHEYHNASTHIASLQAQDSREASKGDRLREERESLRQEYEETKAKIGRLAEQKESKNKVLVQLREEEQELIAMSGSSIGQLKEYDDKLHVISADKQGAIKQINALVRRSDALNRDLEDLTRDERDLEKIISAFGLDPEMETFDVESVIGGLTAEIESLDALNAKALETYLEVSFGYRSMSKRKNSLEEERNSIVRFIEEIEKDKRQTFLDAFDNVDKEIRLIFNKMTEGGNAWLELQNEDDIFNSGISYMIQFPNKPKRESTSISGGEKTLAAIVFVLALQKLKPSPFYLFDEVDAHLDAPNALRLARILEERSKESQFIMVSLKDSVVQKARLIYGVFPKNGVSHVVTYKDKRVSQPPRSQVQAK